MKWLLQVKTDKGWKYVFCYNQYHSIVTTNNPDKALLARDLEYFQNKFGNNEFRVDSHPKKKLAD